MKKLLLFAVFVLMASSCFGAFYKSYEGTLTGNTTEAILTVADDVGVIQAKGGYIKNDSTVSNLLAYFLIQGATYGDRVTIKPQEIFDMNNFDRFKNIKLDTVTTLETVAYRVVTGIQKTAIEGM
jgi:hypothetical protein